jgi:hypothetical protein
MDQELNRCPYKIRWTFGQDADCQKAVHLPADVTASPMDPRLEHEALIGNGATKLTWHSGDRREFMGDWPGPCPGSGQGCTLHIGHHGNHAP